MNKQCFIMKNNIYLIWIISEQLIHIVIVGVFIIALYLLLLF